MPQNTNPINAKLAVICGVTLALTLALAAPVSAQQTSSVTTQQAALIARPMMIARQGSFFVGGHGIFSDTLSTLPNYAASGTVTVDQMYVHYQVPVKAKPLSLTLIHGCCLTGKTWESTPNGRVGWDEYFVRKGYSTYVIDQAERGR